MLRCISKKGEEEEGRGTIKKAFDDDSPFDPKRGNENKIEKAACIPSSLSLHAAPAHTDEQLYIFRGKLYAVLPLPPSILWGFISG